MTCNKCGKRTSKTEDIVAHRCDHTAVPPPQKPRSCRPKEPPPQRSHYSPPNYLNMGGISLGPPGYNQSYEQRIKEWELCQRHGWQEDYNKQLNLDESSDLFEDW